MAAITTVDALIARISNEFDETFLLRSDWGTGRLATSGTNANQMDLCRVAYCKSVPGSLPTGVTAYIPTEFRSDGAAGLIGQGILLAEMIDLGHLDIAGPTFTDGSAMPTRTELGVSRQVPGFLVAEVSTALNATPGTYTVTYVDQDGNTAETTAAMTPSASAAVGSAGQPALNSTDWGVLDVTNATRSGGTTPTGVLQFWGLIPIAMLCNALSTTITLNEDLINGGMVRRLGAGAKIGAFTHPSSTAAAGAFVASLRMVGDS